MGQALLDGALSFGKSAASAWVGGFVVGTWVGIVVSWFVDVLGLLKDGLLDLIFD